MKKIKIGWIGSGFVGQTAHLSSFSNIKNIEISALAELRQELGKKVQKKYSIKNLYKDHEELLKSEKFDAVVAIVRRYHTYHVAKAVLKSKNHLFTEKPMAANYEQGKNLVSIAKKNNLKYVIGNMRRHDDGINYAYKIFKKFLKTKELGNLLFFRCYCYAGYDYCNIDGDIKSKENYPNYYPNINGPKWMGLKKRSGFEKFLAYFVHDLNLINLFFGDNYKIKKKIINQNSGTISLEYPDYFGNFDFTYVPQKIWEEGMEIYFDWGKIIIEMPPAFLRNQPSKIKIYKYRKSSQLIQPRFDWKWSFKNQAESFINIIQEKSKNISSGSDSLKDLKMAEEIWK